MSVDVPGTDHHLRALCDLAVPQHLRPGIFAHHHRHRRIKPQRLAEHVAGEAQLGQFTKHRPFGQRLRFCRHPLLHVRMGGEQIQGPSQRRGRGFMPGQKEDRHLIHHFRRLEPPSGLWVGGGHDLGRQIVRGHPARNLTCPGLRQFGDQRPDPRRRPRRGPPVKARKPARQRQKSGEVQDRLAALIAAEFGKHLCRDPVFDRNREQRSKDHIRCSMAHFRLDLHLARGQPRHRRLPGRHHRRKGIAQAAAFKRRVDDPPLAFPDRAVGHKDRIAQQRCQPLADAVGFREIIGALDQHQIDQLRVIGEVAAEKRRPKLGHPRVVQPRGLRRQDIGAEQFQIDPQRNLVRPWHRLWRDHGSVRWPETARSIRLFDGARPL